MSALRFVYLTDTHVGCGPSGYFLQPRYLDHERAMFAGLARWIKDNDVAFVVHGGDLTDHGTRDEIDHASALCAMLEVPVYLCLGNHDLAQTDSMTLWRDSALWRASGGDCFSIDAGAATLIVANHHWHEQVDDRWLAAAAQSPRLDDRQQRALGVLLDQGTGPVIAVTHAPLNAVPIHQPGREEMFHLPHPPYLATWQRIAAEHPRLKLVMCGHNHASSRHDHGSFMSCTTTAFNEAPAQVRVVDVSPARIEVSTVALAAFLGLPAALDSGEAWCLGDETARSFTVRV